MKSLLVFVLLASLVGCGGVAPEGEVTQAAPLAECCAPAVDFVDAGQPYMTNFALMSCDPTGPIALCREGVDVTDGGVTFLHPGYGAAGGFVCRATADCNGR